MNYYSLNDVIASYGISKTSLKTKIIRGEILAEKLYWSRCNRNVFMLIIPENELIKLKEYKIRELILNEKSQPDYYIKKWQEDDERRKKRQEEYEKEVTLRKERILIAQNYKEYLQSKEWKQKALQCFERDKFKCRICGSAINIRAHHLTYKRLGYEELDDLITVCKKCHKNILHEKDLRR